MGEGADTLNFSFVCGVSDLRTQLSATDYGNFLANEPMPISTSTISEKATQVLVDQFNFLRSNAVEPLSKFLEYMTCVCFADVGSTESLTGLLRVADGLGSLLQVRIHD